ncbi:MAG: transglycosylase domain-containing protein [Paracoccaceae bacterium]
MAWAWVEARRDAPALLARAETLARAGRGGDALGPRGAWLIAVQDPGFRDHSGLDFSTPGAGATTLTQSLAKRLAFDRFTPGIRKLRQSAYAIGLEQRLDKDLILTLFLDTVPMGQGPDGWMTGFFAASQAVFHRPPAQLSDAEFLRLVAVMIAPSRFSLTGPDSALDRRAGRIARLIAGTCHPRDHGDVWLEGCAEDESAGIPPSGRSRFGLGSPHQLPPSAKARP